MDGHVHYYYCRVSLQSVLLVNSLGDRNLRGGEIEGIRTEHRFTVFVEKRHVAFEISLLPGVLPIEK